MIVDVCPIYMSTDNIGLLTFGKSCGELTANLICFLRRDLSRLEGLTELIGDYVAVLYSAGVVEVLFFRHLKLRACKIRVALIGGNQLAAFCLLRVHRVIRPV